MKTYRDLSDEEKNIEGKAWDKYFSAGRTAYRRCAKITHNKWDTLSNAKWNSAFEEYHKAEAVGREEYQKTRKSLGMRPYNGL